MVAVITLFGMQAAFAQVDSPLPPNNVAELPAVSVTATHDDDYRARSASVAGFDETPLRDTPASVSVVTRAQLDD